MKISDISKIDLSTEDIAEVALDEKVKTDFIVSGLEDGTIVIPKNNNRSLKKIIGIGKGLRTKVNANIGTSPVRVSIKEEIKKLKIAVKFGADAIMDLSTGGDIDKIRKIILDECPVCVGTVPIYQAACETVSKGNKIAKMDPGLLFDIIEKQAEDGVDFMTVHCGITKKSVEILERQKRVTGVVSRGGSFLVKWIKANGKENPLFENYDRLIDIAKKYNVTLSLGDGLRPGSICDATDDAQIAELKILGELVLEARKNGVQAIIEGPGHVPLNKIQQNVELGKKYGYNAPLYFLGPLVTDIAAGFDHITSAIGGAIAASYGVDFLCYVTPAEHLRLPDVDDVYMGVIASKIAAHAADIVKNVPGAKELDLEFSKWRKDRHWRNQERLSLDPEKFRNERAKMLPNSDDECAMCGQFCAMKD
ncbi:MAG: phosphomethylpyrimidine synthase ThiC [Elusimicrobia bacterium]|nr:phosphomethylpyrimidine synthase ThiC [Elusimicrobiota bacterium]